VKSISLPIFEQNKSTKFRMKVNQSKYISIVLKGMAMGAADVVPGVSGGTIAFITGIYEELITSISNINFSLIAVLKNDGFSAFWKKLNGNFLLSLFLGILISIFSLMKLTSYLIENHPIYIWSFFFGLVLASIWYVGKQIEKWNAVNVIGLLVAAVLAYVITLLTPASEEAGLPYLFLCGALAICAMILPGISGAFILVLLGVYEKISTAVSEFDLVTVATVGAGAIVGLLSFSKLLKWLFNNYKNFVLAVLTGFIAGSLNKIWPWKEVTEVMVVKDKEIPISELSVLPQNFNGDAHLIPAIICACVGFLCILALEYFGGKTRKVE
jgi:putative membrane protein